MRASPNPQVLGWLDREDARGLFVSAVSEAEIRTGLGLLPDGRRRRELTDAADRVLDEWFSGRVLPFDAQPLGSTPTLRAIAGPWARPISQFDCQIAAIAHSRGMSVATRDVDRFRGCGIDVNDPWSDR